MTIRLDMRRAVIKAKEALGDSAGVVRQFFRQHLNDDGGFAGRDGRSECTWPVWFGAAPTWSIVVARTSTRRHARP